MNVVIHPHPLCGTIEIPSSKSVAHRLLIAAALSDSPTQLRLNALNEDILATAQCLRALGADIQESDHGFTVRPIRAVPNPCELFCNESGSTLRFLIPVAAALGASARFTGAGRLPQRPNALLTNVLRAHGVQADGDLLPLSLSGTLRGGTCAIAGNVSSQYITGLMLALPLCAQDSEIHLTTPLESASYIDVTREALRAFGIRIEPRPNGWFIPGNQRYRTPGALTVEGDWSSAAFWHAANRLGGKVECRNLNPASAQGDRAIVPLLDRLGETVDVSDTPDLVPALAVAAAVHPGTTRIVGAARLRLKESDRLFTVAQMLRALGGQAEELSDGLVIRGQSALTGGTVDGCNDHRIVMAAAIAGAYAAAPVTILGAQAVRKSYPTFFEDFQTLGGIVHVEPDR